MNSYLNAILLYFFRIVEVGCTVYNYLHTNIGLVSNIISINYIDIICIICTMFLLLFGIGYIPGSILLFLVSP